MKLAIDGGTAVRKDPLPYSRQTITDSDKHAALQAMDSSWIAGEGPKTTELELDMAAYTGYKYAVAVNSASTGLMLAYIAAFGKTERPLYVPTYTFVATINSMLHVRLIPYLVDVDEQTLCADGCAVGVSFAGYPVDNCLVADDAQYIHPKMSQRNIDISVLSTHAVKQITSLGEGGIILTNNLDTANLCTSMRNHGRDLNGLAINCGYNFRMTDVQAAVLISQLGRERNNLAWRHTIADMYYRELNPDKLLLPAYHPEHSWHLFTIRLRSIDKDWFRAALASEGILSQVHFLPIHRQPFYREPLYQEYYHFPNADKAYSSILSIPLFSGMTENDARDVITAVNKVLEYA